MIAEGTHTAKPVDWGIVDRGGYIKAIITFKTENDEFAYWTGSLDDVGFAKYTVDTLSTCGFMPGTADEMLAGLAEGPDGRKLNSDGAVSLVIEYSDDGKYANVKYVNAIGSRFQNTLTQKQAAERLKGIDLKSLFSKGQKDVPPPNDGDLSKLPF